jgi:tetratricopeptide (TPR) repeat protein
MSEIGDAQPQEQKPAQVALQDIFNQGMTLHQQGKLADAERIYRDVLRHQPDHFDALHLLGVIALQTRHTERAVELIRKAIALNAQVADAHSNLGKALLDLKRPADALASYDKAIALNPDFAMAHSNRGISLNNLKRPADALASYDKAIALNPNFAMTHINRGTTLLELKRPEDALASYDKAIALNAEFAEAHNNRGNALLELKRPENALASYDMAIALNPALADAHNNRGNALLDLNRSADALASYDKAIALNPELAEAHNNRGNALQRLNRPADALASYDKAIALEPYFVAAHSNRGNTLNDLKRPEEALASCDKAIALKPGFAEAHNNRGNALLGLNRLTDALANYDEAIALEPNLAKAHSNRGNALLNLNRPIDALASCDKAIALKPDYAEAYWNKSLCLLTLGHLEQGWRQYEWRKKCDEPIANRSLPQPLWLGEEDIAGKTVFIWWEQGLGDTIQFCRYAKLVEARGAKVIMSVQQPLHGLLNQISPTIQIIGPDEVPSKFDYHCPLLSLPLAFRTTLETIPAQQQYLKADEQLRLAWAARLPPRTKPRIGLAWSGRTTHKNHYNRSIELEQFLPILNQDSDWVCLQKEVREKDLAVLQQLGRVAFFGDDLNDFSDTAALLDLMDLVITVDTSVAHLAGAMGKPVWILLPNNPDWRWLLDRNDSPWYPTVRLFRQNDTRAWDNVIVRVHDALQCNAIP